MVSRRELLKLLGGGVLVLVLGPTLDAQESGRGGRGGQVPQTIDAWIHIGADGRIRVMSGKVEVGQNARTSIAAAAAEELRVPIESIDVVLGDTDLCPFDQGTFGSRTTPIMIPQIRRAAAAAREELLALAAAKFGVAASTLKIESGKITGGGKATTFGELIGGKSFSKEIPAGLTLSEPKDWQVLGKSHVKQNGRDIVTGKHKYTIDLKRPGMLYARVLRAPSYGAEMVGVKTEAAKKLAGVEVVIDGTFVAVAAPTLRQANSALEALEVEWKEKDNPSSADYAKILRGDSPGPAEAPSKTKVRATFRIPYIAHVPLEPRAALAEWDGEKMTVHTGTQRPFGVRGEVAQALSIPEDRVRVIVPDTGSGYGGKHSGDAAVEAARIARALKKPIMLSWTRREEFMWAYFRPGGVIEASAGANGEGKLDHWEFHNYNSGGSGLRSPYDCASKKEEFHQAGSPLRQGSYRGLAATFNHFARECLVDELADKAGRFPWEFRYENTSDPRLRAVLEKLKELSPGWVRHWEGTTKVGEGRGMGLACGTEKGSTIATIATVHVEGDSFRVEDITSVYECGKILNPLHLENQVNGAILQGLGGALFEEIQCEEGKIINGYLAAYRLPRFGDMPAKITTHLLDRPDLPSAGAGETPIITIAPAIANALYMATKKRFYDLPLRLS